MISKNKLDTDILVVGAGIVGLSICYAFLKKGIIFSVLTTKRTKYKYYIEVLDQLKQAGATKISIANPNN